jgi:NADH-quinone oxidoreductase subunit F
MGSCGIAAGAAEIFDLLKQGGCEVTLTGCIGSCWLEPIVEVDGQLYVKADANAAGEIIRHGRADGYAIKREDLDAIKAQTRIALQNCGIIDPENIDEYIANGGYEAIKRCRETMTPEQVIAEIKISGLLGRGGAGFPTWFKWDAARKSAGEKKYIICNADEGDPGAFMDRAIIEGDPHAVIEGMMTAAYAIGSDEGLIYVRAEYPLAVKRLQTALKQAKERGFLKTLRIKLAKGAGAFVCGEETALIASIEAQRGMPRLKPPFPAEKGLWDSPSNINNVETLANIPYIIHNNAKADTKVFAVTGKVEKSGLVEAKIGSTINDVLNQCAPSPKIKAVQLGGPSGGCIPKELFDTEIDYAKLIATGAIMGSGGMVIADEATCMVDMARFFLDFTVAESCGKCTHCRVGNKRMSEILERICAGQGVAEDIARLQSLGEAIKSGSLCALGQTAPNPVLTTLKYFRDEYDAHINDKKCPAGTCRKLFTYSINMNNCVKCGLCVKNCPADAICSQFIIDMNKCVKCGVCANVCRFKAVEVS